jgi:hypothetical protein
VFAKVKLPPRSVRVIISVLLLSDQVFPVRFKIARLV